MTTQQPEQTSYKNFSNSTLPWIVFAGALVLYLVTLNHWVTLGSLPVVSRISGWDWRPAATSPLYLALTSPIRLLPESWHPLMLNLFSAICATLSLTLLARSVALLPHDRTKEQRAREESEFSLLTIRRAWVAPAIAVLVCGLQLTFWEHAVAASGEMLNLLVFAYVIRCLLEFRVALRNSWLYKMSFIYGLGITNDWSLIAYFPCFVLLVVFLKGISFLNAGFLLRMAGLLIIGMLLYLLLPIISMFSISTESDFWLVLKSNLGFQKMFLLRNPFIYGLKLDLMTMLLTSLVPAILICIRWTSDYSDVSAAGTAVTDFMFRLLHLVFLVFCVWIFFDYKFSPRALGRGFSSFLTLYYLSALSVGYLTGYILLVFGREPHSWGKSRSKFRKIYRAIAYLVLFAAIGVPATLFCKNFPAIRRMNSDDLLRFGQQMYDKLPAQAVVLSDDAVRLNLVKAVENKTGNGQHHIFLHTQSLPFSGYHAFLRRQYPNFQKFFAHKIVSESVPDDQILALVIALSQIQPIYYLHYSFGYYFEHFYPRQHGLIAELKPLSSDLAPKLTADEITANNAEWDTIFRLASIKSSDNPDKLTDAYALAVYYSSAADWWGVDLQKNNHLKEAEQMFSAALRWDARNVVAEINRRYNSNLQHGDATKAVESDEGLTRWLDALGGPIGAISQFGPIDEINGCYLLGQTLANGSNIRQSIQYFARVLELAPDSIPARLAMARSYIAMGEPDKALSIIAEIRKKPIPQIVELQLIDLESSAYFVKGDYKKAEQLILSTLEENLQDAGRANLALQFYLRTANVAFHLHDSKTADERFERALGIVEQAIGTNPSVDNLLVKAGLLIQLRRYDDAIALLNQILAKNPAHPTALMNRAITFLQMGRLNQARQDYEELVKLHVPLSYRAYYGLGEIAWNKKDKGTAIKNYEKYLETAPRGTGEAALVQKRLQLLESGKAF